MSQEESLSRREKRAKRDAERHRIGKKRKQEDIEKVQDNNEKDFIPLASGSTEGAEDGSKKRKRPELEDTVEHAESAVSAPENAGAGAAPAPKSKKRRKNKSSNQAADGDAATNAAPNTVEGNPAEEPASKQRFIVFIGNLPYTATTESITKHFASISPTSVRHLTDPATGKSKGYAFLEFTNYDRMKTCLKLYHHTTFDSGAGGEKGQRKINVELTAGGGGKGGNRKEKLKVKNTRLEEQRHRRAEVERKQGERKQKKGRGQEQPQSGKKTPGDRTPWEARQKNAAPQDTGGMEGMNPARLAMLQGK